MPRTSPQTCPLCGAEITGDHTCRSSCPRLDRCGVVCCPHCSYTFPDERIGVAGMLRRLFQRRRGR